MPRSRLPCWIWSAGRPGGREAADANQERLRDIAARGTAGEPVTVPNAHDPWDYLRLSGATAR
ncbi:hypothetical protein [Streptomyces sp. GS7]|uniref:hypothetical protein n=1 Tax=Streptomyces sp. GS7 TaxID=2692234 RepID=UPI0013190450|nr:hypothetical protein [Streptomyces sp. GS7]QHC24782.1 hypothetical protein GR130_28815 [Streptomyces sp. GS7]